MKPATVKPATVKPAILRPAVLRPAVLRPATMEPAAGGAGTAAALVALALGLAVVGGARAQDAAGTPAASTPPASTPAAPATSPVGLWKTIDDETGKPKAIVRISAADGVLAGRIEKLLDPSRPNPTCDACTDERKGRPIEGLTILTGLKPADDGSGWEDGRILDPNNGKVYRARARLVDGGRKLEVRGFIGVALFGRTQTWIRD